MSNKNNAIGDDYVHPYHPFSWSPAAPLVRIPPQDNLEYRTTTAISIKIDDVYKLGECRIDSEPFELHRGFDESGVSGTGKVLEGIIFSDGTVAVRWVTENAPRSTVVYSCWEDFVNIHVQSHATNQTYIRFRNGYYWEQQPDPKLVIERNNVRHYGHYPNNIDSNCSICLIFHVKDTDGIQ